MENSYDAETYRAVYNGGSYEKGGYFTTFSGHKFNPFDPDVWNLIDIKDIAHAQSNICRFGGHVRQNYSLAQHSVLVSYMCNPEDALDGLLHDSSEAYIADIVRPVKETKLFESYRWLESKLEQDVAKKFGTRYPMPASVKAADMEVVVWEALNLFKPVPEWVSGYLDKHPFELVTKLEKLANDTNDSAFWPFNCWPHHLAKAKFMKRFLELSGINV